MGRLRVLLAVVWLLSLQGSSSESETAAAELQVAALTNNVRHSRGLRPLTFNSYLQRAARSHSQEMFVRGYFDHVSPMPGRRYPWDRLNRVGVDADSVAENLYMAVGHPLSDVPSMAIASWLGSPEHRENLFDPHKSQIGVGLWVQGDTIYVTQMLSSAVSAL